MPWPLSTTLNEKFVQEANYYNNCWKQVKLRSFFVARALSALLTVYPSVQFFLRALLYFPAFERVHGEMTRRLELLAENLIPWSSEGGKNSVPRN